MWICLLVIDVDMFILKTTGSYDKASTKVCILYQRNLASGSVKKSCCSVWRKSIDYFLINNEDSKDFFSGSEENC